MTVIGLIIFVICSYEIFNLFKTKKLISDNIELYKSFFSSIKDKSLSDDKKQHEVLEFSKKLLFNCLKIIFLFLSIILLILLENIIFKNLLVFLLSLKGVFSSIILLILYHFLKKNLNAKL